MPFQFNLVTINILIFLSLLIVCSVQLEITYY